MFCFIIVLVEVRLLLLVKIFLSVLKNVLVNNFVLFLLLSVLFIVFFFNLLVILILSILFMIIFW